MTTITYTIEFAEDEKCYECGGEATIVLVADSSDDTGHVDEIPLCHECAEKREV